MSPAQRSMGRRIRGLLPISKELLLSSDNTAEVVQGNIATKRARAKQHYDTTASSTLPSLEIGDFVYVKPSPHHKSGPWLYGLVTAIPAPRSYIVETPAGLTRRNRAHLRPAAPPPPGAVVPRSWMDKPSPSPVPASEHSARLPTTPQVVQPVNSPSTLPSTRLPCASPVVQPVLPPFTPPAVQLSAPNEPPVQNTVVKAPLNQSVPVPLVTNVEEPDMCSQPSPTAKRSQTNKSEKISFGPSVQTAYTFGLMNSRSSHQ